MKIKFLQFTTLTIITCILNLLNAQIQKLTVEKTEISGGAEFNLLLQEAINSGNSDLFRPSDLGPPIASAIEGANFLGFNFDDNATENSGFVFIPPDPSGAAGTDRVISVVNTMIECRSKTGTLIFRDALRDFFTSLAPTTPTFDPKVIYDQYENRFLVVTLEQVQSGSNPNAGNISRILLAVSKTGSPATATTTDWYYQAIDSKVTLSGVDLWADYPGFAVDEEAVYITNNMFEFDGGSGSTPNTVRLWIIDKGTVGGFYAGTANIVPIYNPYSGAGIAVTTQPAHIFGAGGVGTGNGTFLVSYSTLTNGVQEFVQIVRVDDPLGSPTFSQQYVNVGDLESGGGLTDAPQNGPPAVIPIEVNDQRALHSVWRNSSLFLTTTIKPNSGSDNGQTTAHWFELNTTTLNSITVEAQGDIGGEDIATGAYTFFPSIAVNKNMDVIIGFAASASSIYCGAYYIGRRVGDTPGTLGPSQTMKAGLDYYVRTFGGARNRWGDYSGTSVDPSDDETFWVFNEYAEIRGSSPPDDGRWGTVFASVGPADPLPVELVSFDTNISGNTVNLNWATATEVDNYGFEIERKSFNQTNWEKIGFVNGSGNSNTEHKYSFIDENPIGGFKLQYRLKQIDNDGSFDYSNVVEIELVPETIFISQNYPNPFNPSTSIQFTLPSDANVKLKVSNILGESASVLVDDFITAGNHKFEFDAAELPSGIYFYTLEVDGKLWETKKMMLLK